MGFSLLQWQSPLLVCLEWKKYVNYASYVPINAFVSCFPQLPWPCSAVFLSTSSQLIQGLSLKLLPFTSNPCAPCPNDFKSSNYSWLHLIIPHSVQPAHSANIIHTFIFYSLELISLQFSLASSLCSHITVATTERSYNFFPPNFKPLTLHFILRRWFSNPNLFSVSHHLEKLHSYRHKNTVTSVSCQPL